MATKSNITKGSASQIEETRVVSNPVEFDDLLNARGASGTYIVNGFLEGDYNANLTGIRGLQLYDEMRKSDSKIRQSLMVCKLPILSTEWYIEPAKDPETGEVGEAEQEVADFVAKALFEKMEITWQNYLLEVLTLLEFGFSVFEKVYTADEDDEFIWLKKIAYRKQTTIQKWEMENGAAGITQQLPSSIVDPNHVNANKNTIDIPASKMLLFTFQREGDNYTGVSVLRSAYKHWYIKDALYKFDTIKHERQGVGIPFINLPKNATEKDKAEARAILKNLRANQQGGLVMPNPDWKAGFLDLQAGNTSDMWKSIEHHNQEIANNVLAMFLNLVSGDGGSRALSEDQSDFFLLANEALANLIEDVHNRFCVPELVDLNFEVTDYPKLRHRKLGSVDYTTIASVLSTASSAGVLTPDEDTEDWFRKLIDAPPKMQEEVVEEEIDPETGLPIEPEIDPLTGLPIEPELDEDGNPIEAELDPETGLPIEPELDPETGLPVEAAEFRAPMDEATKKKISDALKKRGGGRAPVRPVRQVRQAPAPVVPAVKKTKIGSAINQIKMQKRTGGVAERLKARVKKKLDREGRSSDDESLNKAIGKAKQTAAQNRSQAQVKGINEAAKNAAKGVKKGKAGKAAKEKIKADAQAAKNKIKQDQGKAKDAATEAANAKRRADKAAKDAAPKKKKGKKKMSEHTHERDDYDRIFAEGAHTIMQIQSFVEFDKGVLPQGKQVFKEGNPYKAFRPLTFAEEKVNWKSLKKSVESFRTALDGEVSKITEDQKADLLSQVKRAVDNNNIAAVGAIKAKYTGDLSAALTNVQKEMFEAGKSAVAREMGVTAPTTAREVLGAMKVSNAKLVEKLNNDMANAASDAVSQIVIKKGGAITSTGTADAVNAASEAIDKVLESTAKINTLTIMGSLNLGRATIFERYPELIYGFQYSAIIDDVTTDVCLSLDGRVVAAGSADFYTYGPPRHYECRSVWTEILQDEEFKPETDDIPSRIPSNPTIDRFQDMKAPVVQENSPALKVIHAEIEERLAKVKEYEDAGLYPNRIESHKARISALEDALGDNVSLGSVDITERDRVDKGGK